MTPRGEGGCWDGGCCKVLDSLPAWVRSSGSRKLNFPPLLCSLVIIYNPHEGTKMKQSCNIHSRRPKKKKKMSTELQYISINVSHAVRCICMLWLGFILWVVLLFYTNIWLYDLILALLAVRWLLLLCKSEKKYWPSNTHWPASELA